MKSKDTGKAYTPLIIGNVYPSGGEAGQVMDKNGICKIVKQSNILVLESPKSISTLTKSLDTDTQESGTTGTPQESSQKNSQISRFFAEGFRASPSPSLGSEWASRIREARYSSILRELPSVKDHNSCSLRMLKDSYRTITGELLPSFYPRWMSWGMMSSGKCLTANISESRRIGRECSLSDILEKDVGQKYFLSERVAKNLKLYNERQEKNQTGFRANFTEPTETMEALKVGGRGANDLVKVQ